MSRSGADPGRWVWGFHPVREALRARPGSLIEVVVSARPGKRRSDIERLCVRHGVGRRDAPGDELDHLAGGGVHNGFAARIRPSGEPGPPADPDLWVLLEDVQDPRNLGALLRVCDGAGVGRVVVRDRGSAPLSPIAVKASAGAAEWVAVERVPNSRDVIREMKGRGGWVWGAAAEGDAAWSVDLTGPVLLCLGGEGTGLRHHTRELCDGLVGLPLRGRVESLNVATAAAALLYEAVRQRIG